MRWLAALAICAACGDDRPPAPVHGAVSGARLALQWYGFPDGVRQPEPDEFYDRVLHARCAPRAWVDGVVRCVPDADQAAYLDDACTQPVGRGVSIEEPTHFIGHDLVDGQLWPARLYIAGDELDTVKRYYLRLGSDCQGPYFDPEDVQYFGVLGELGGGDLVALRERTEGDGRLALQVRESDDGMRVPLGLRDQALDADCAAVVRDDGEVRCEPIDATPATYFRDPACAEPVVAVGGGDEPPALAQVTEPSGCAAYREVGDELAPALYRREGDACTPVAIVPPPRVFALGAPVAPLPLERTLEPGGGRLQRVVLGDGEMQVYDDVLYDHATRADCRRHRFEGEDGVRCIPAALAAAFLLYTPTCAVAVDVTLVPQRSCRRPAFAAATTAAGLELHAIGDRAGEPLHVWNFGPCRPYVATPGTTVHLLGPAIDPTAFAGALYYGER